MFKIAHNVDEAVDEILQFYKVYNSIRWVGEQVVIRITQPLTASAVADLNKRFAKLVRKGEITQGGGAAARKRTNPRFGIFHGSS